ncbi:MAG TPA: hypothetical protein VGV35_13070, partial [Bryobacteraceae bacterium]|nr:hypothetical protein [Bryobacteraceae bacterium]
MHKRWASKAGETTMMERGKFGWAAIAVLALCIAGLGQSNSYVAAAPAVENSVYATALLSASANGNDESVLTIRKRVDEVNVLFIATDRHGKFVRNLNQNDFSFYDDHKPVQSILNFRRETDLPIEMGLLIDSSGSVHNRFGFEKEAALGFLRHIIRPGYDKAFVVG